MWSIIATVLVMFLGITLFGYGMHYCLHQPFMGRFYRAHQTHHNILYPASDFYSYLYRSPGKDNTVFFFVAAGTPLIVLPVILFAFHIIGLPILITAMIGLGVFGILHDLLHDAFHIKHHWLRKFRWFEELTDLHYTHHLGNMQSNLGIFWFGWDRLFGTFRKR
jgi:sterol desaturase/sphingolipid hydroxylase (fatty acid hydroxylase superfamily)